MERGKTGNAMSATRHNCIVRGMLLDPDTVADFYGVTKECLKLFTPIECPKMCLTKNGVLRPWTLDVCFGKEQASCLQRLLREEFWHAVDEYNEEYAEKMNGKRYPAADMIEAFCQHTGTSDVHVDAMRREWQRRRKRQDDFKTQPSRF